MESRLEVLMQTNETLQSQLADASLYEVSEKSKLMKILEEEKTLRAEERKLMEEWDTLTVEIEQLESLDI